MIRKTDRVIRVRVSEEEFTALQDASKKAGSPSISDLTVSTMHQLTEPEKVGTLDSKNAYLWIKEFINRLNSVQAEIDRLETLLNIKRQQPK